MTRDVREEVTLGCGIPALSMRVRAAFRCRLVCVGTYTPLDRERWVPAQMCTPTEGLTPTGPPVPQSSLLCQLNAFRSSLGGCLYAVTSNVSPTSPGTQTHHDSKTDLDALTRHGHLAPARSHLWVLAWQLAVLSPAPWGGLSRPGLPDTHTAGSCRQGPSELQGAGHHAVPRGACVSGQGAPLPWLQAHLHAHNPQPSHVHWGGSPRGTP